MDKNLIIIEITNALCLHLYFLHAFTPFHSQESFYSGAHQAIEKQKDYDLILTYLMYGLDILGLCHERL